MRQCNSHSHSFRVKQIQLERHLGIEYRTYNKVHLEVLVRRKKKKEEHENINAIKIYDMEGKQF